MLSALGALGIIVYNTRGIPRVDISSYLVSTAHAWTYHHKFGSILRFTERHKTGPFFRSSSTNRINTPRVYAKIYSDGLPSKGIPPALEELMYF